MPAAAKPTAFADIVRSAIGHHHAAVAQTLTAETTLNRQSVNQGQAKGSKTA